MKNFLFLSFIVSLFFISCKKNEDQIKKVYYEGEDISNLASIIRNKETKKATLIINVAGKWVLYAGASDSSIDYSKPVAGGFQAGRYDLDVSDSSRVYFQLVTEKSRTMLSERRLPMLGGYNFRDLGGIKNTEGRFVKWGKIFRSDDLYNLTESDLNYLSSIPIVSVVDFRSETEIEKAPDKLPESVVLHSLLPISPGNLNLTDQIFSYSAEQMDSVMMDMNKLLVSDSASVKQYRELFKLLQNDKDVPLMFHCSAGKDRTGMAAALILFALGVDEETILEDYLSSNMYLGDKYADIIDEQPNLKPLFEVKVEFLKTGIEKIKEDHKSVENYLESVLNVDILKFKEMYLY